jgi:drug/metabolite transporter (DMT)-like permease
MTNGMTSPARRPQHSSGSSDPVSGLGTRSLVWSWRRRQPVTLTAAVILSVLALGLLGTGAAYVLNYRLIADEGATAASTVTYLLPVVAITLGIIVLGEAISWTLFAGTALVLLGIAISEGRLPGISRAVERGPTTKAGRSEEA